MKFTVSWLKDHLETNATNEKILNTLTNLGLEVEESTDQQEALKSFIVAEITDVQKHPDADKLQICEVNTGKKLVEVVCGAPNVRKGMKGVFADLDTTIPSTGDKISKVKIRGVESYGMLCSARDLALGDDHEGILELPDSAVTGEHCSKFLGLNDFLITVDITPNRADCLGVRGIARDLSATGLGKLKPLSEKKVDGKFKSPIDIHLDFSKKESASCPIFAGRYIRNLKNVDSPKWLSDRLSSVGLRPVSALVDITNYFTFNLNRPLHVFDSKKINGNLKVNFSRDGEKLRALDGKTYSLKKDMVVIRDEKKILSLGGVIGGEEGSCSNQTTDAFLECAYFDPKSISATGRQLMIDSDSRFRFERGVDPESVLSGIESATQMIIDICGGEASEIVLAGKNDFVKKTINFNLKEIPRLTGLDITAQKVRTILESLGFNLKEKNNSFSVEVPSWRNDISVSADLVEEVLRIYGYDNIPDEPFGKIIPSPLSGLSSRKKIEHVVRKNFATRGFYEVITWSFMKGKSAALFGGENQNLKLLNPISSDLDMMRPSILPNLLTAAKENLDRGNKNFSLFEIGPSYSSLEEDGQKLCAAGIRIGGSDRHWRRTSQKFDFYDIKADILSCMQLFKLSEENIEISNTIPKWYHPGQSASFHKKDKSLLASFGALHPEVLSEFDLKDTVIGFELYIDSLTDLVAEKKKQDSNLTLSPLQSVDRDFAFIVDQKVTSKEIMNLVKNVDTQLIDNVKVFDIYQGGEIPQGKKSYAISVCLQPTDKTLTEEEINQLSEKIVLKIKKEIGAVLRD